MEPGEALLRLAVAALGGLAVGVEREWSARREADKSRFAGVRTFLLLGLLGGLAATAAASGEPWFGLLILAAGAALVVIAYLVSAWHGTIDATTEVAGVIVLGTGALAGLGQPTIASAVFAATALVLVAKGRMHAAVERIQSAELEAGARFAVLALVVLPLVPSQLVTPLGTLEPRKLWALVLLFAGLSFVGYIALRVAGPGRGYAIAGLLGGLVSSTAVALNFTRASRGESALARPLAVGVLAGSAVLPVRVLTVAAVVAPALAGVLVASLAPLLLVTIVTVVVSVRRRDDASTAASGLLPSNPLRLGAAMQMAVLFAVVLSILGWVSDRFGASGVVSGAAMLGLADLDALTYSVSELVGRTLTPDTAVRALLVGMLSNTAFKTALVVGLGAPGFRSLAAGGFALQAVAIAAGLLIA